MTTSDRCRQQSDTTRLRSITSIDELASFYAEPPDGVRANMIYSADGAAAFGGRTGPLSSETDRELLRILRGFADVVLVGAATARTENYGPVQLNDAQHATRRRCGRFRPPPVAVISRTGELPPRLVSDPSQPPLLITSAETAARHDRTGDQRCGVLVAGERFVDVVTAVALLRHHGLSRVLCEGGPTLLDRWSAPTRSGSLRDAGAQARRQSAARSPAVAVAVGFTCDAATRTRVGPRRLPVSEVLPLTSLTSRRESLSASDVRNRKAPTVALPRRSPTAGKFKWRPTPCCATVE